MISRNGIIIFILCFNIFCCFVRFDTFEGKEESPQQPRKTITTFEELDRVMSNSEFSKAWKKFKYEEYHIKSEDDYLEPEDESDLKFEYKSFAQTDDSDDNIKDTCLLSEEETKKKLKDAGIKDPVITDDVRFIYGNCNPVLMIPGMLSTKLQVRINCKNMYNDEIDIFKKVKFYCGNDICQNKDATNEEYDLFIAGMSHFALVELFGYNKYAGCLGYFLTFFNSRKACAPYKEDGEDDYVCNYSENIRIGYYGYKTDNQKEGQCGLKAIRDAIAVPDLFNNNVNTGVSRSLGPLTYRLIKKGYKPGFSLGGIPNDYRQFLVKNNFTIEALHHQIEKFYYNTGKPVILIGHSHGTITLYNSLVHKRNKDILYKIKKFVAVGPPFAGSSELIDVFFNDENKYKASINIGGEQYTAGFDQFGFGFIINKLPTAIELRPLPIIGDLFTKPGYEIFAEAIKERFFLEKKCGHTKCDDYVIKKYSQKFNALFKDYFPLLTDDDCKFEENLEERKDVYNRKCLMEMINMIDCPMVIEESRDKNGNLPDDFYSYCGKFTDNLYFQKSCDNSYKQCLDQVYSKHIKYIYDPKTSEKLQFFINRWKDKEYEDYQSKYGECDASFYPEEKKYKASPQKEIDYFNKISLIKDMPTPTVDTDIVYSTYSPSVGAFIFDKEDWGKNYKRFKQGGDGIVPNWAPIIPGLKWIFDTKKYNLKTKIRLVEFCSRLAKDSKYKYNPDDPDQKFAALSCTCIDSNNNSYIEGSCGHGMMVQDSFFLEYIDTVVNDPKNAEAELDKNKTIAYYNYNNNTNYEQDCNTNLLNILYNSMGNETSSEYW